LPSDSAVQICRGFTNAQWNELKLRLRNSDGTPKDDQAAWKCAIEIFERRVTERFLAPIEALEQADSKADVEVAENAPTDCSALPAQTEALVVVPGFAIMALCCLLAETLQSFRSKQEAPQKLGGPCPYPAGACIKAPGTTTTDALKAFLRRPAFNNSFVAEDVAVSFIRGIRNGILHEAETREWVIWRNEPAGQVVTRGGDQYVLNRTEFYRCLKAEFISYLTELRDPQSNELRFRFCKKMNDLVKAC
jgi:hypothetical protein